MGRKIFAAVATVVLGGLFVYLYHVLDDMHRGLLVFGSIITMALPRR